MQFYIDRNSPIPVASQIQEQIKLAVMMGIFRKGDTLPSIRDIEKQTGINRNQIHKAYLALRKSGLLVLTRGKGSVVAAAGEAPRATEEKCRKLSKKIVARVRQMGLSPTAFIRYLSRYVRENELNAPFIVFVDNQQEIASRTAEEISRLWQVPVVGLAFHDLKAALGSGAVRRKILVNHMACESVRALLPRNKSDVIPIELRTSDQIEKDLEKIRSNSSVMVIHRPQPLHSIQFILAPLRRDLEPRGIQLLSHAIRDTSGFRELLKESRHDYYLVGPGAWPDVPVDLRQDPRVLQLGVHLDPASLESARVRAGVIV
jgi:GntR family transcriptional regulator